MRMKVNLLGGILVVILGSAIACSSASPPTTSPGSPASASTPQASSTQQPAPPSGERQVFEILEQGEAYQPNRITVKAGTPVRFIVRNNDAEQHNITSAQVQLPVNLQEPGNVYTVDWVAPTQPGTYEAVCTFHLPDMKMSILVQ